MPIAIAGLLVYNKVDSIMSSLMLWPGFKSMFENPRKVCLDNSVLLWGKRWQRINTDKRMVAGSLFVYPWSYSLTPEPAPELLACGHFSDTL
jgi:hypothetical protein